MCNVVDVIMRLLFAIGMLIGSGAIGLIGYAIFKITKEEYQ